MHLSHKRTLKIRMGDYESFDTEAFASVSHHDLGITDDVWVGLTQVEREEHLLNMQSLLGAELDAAMADDIADAKALCGDRKSFIHRIPTEKD